MRCWACCVRVEVGGRGVVWCGVGGVISEGTARIVVDEVASSMNFVMLIAAFVSAAVLIGGIIGYVTIGRPNRAKVTV